MREVRGSSHLCSTNRIKHLGRPRVLPFSRFRGLWRQVDLKIGDLNLIVRPRSHLGDGKAESMQRAEIVFITPDRFESGTRYEFLQFSQSVTGLVGNSARASRSHFCCKLFRFRRADQITICEKPENS